MEHNIHSMYSHFWRDAYLAALRAGRADPAGAADDAFMAFDCRFGEAPTDGAGAWGLSTLDMAKHADAARQKEKLGFLTTQDPSKFEMNLEALDQLKREAWPFKANDQRSYLPSTERPPTEGLPPAAAVLTTADVNSHPPRWDSEAMQEKWPFTSNDNGLPPPVVGEVFRLQVVKTGILAADPPTEGLPPYEWKSDDEVLG